MLNNTLKTCIFFIALAFTFELKAANESQHVDCELQEKGLKKSIKLNPTTHKKNLSIKAQKKSKSSSFGIFRLLIPGKLK